MRVISSALALGTILSGCQENLVRSDLVSPYSGNAVAINASNQTIDPWPVYVNDTRLLTSSERQAGALKKYRTKHDEVQGGAPGQLIIAPSAPAKPQ